MAIINIKRKGDMEVKRELAERIKLAKYGSADTKTILKPSHTPVFIDSWTGTLADIGWIDLNASFNKHPSDREPTAYPELTESEKEENNKRWEQMGRDLVKSGTITQEMFDSSAEERQNGGKIERREVKKPEMSKSIGQALKSRHDEFCGCSDASRMETAVA